MRKRINDYDVLYKAVQKYVENRGGVVEREEGVDRTCYGRFFVPTGYDNCDSRGYAASGCSTAFTRGLREERDQKK
jgi:hypothetical protein